MIFWSGGGCKTTRSSSDICCRDQKQLPQGFESKQQTLETTPGEELYTISQTPKARLATIWSRWPGSMTPRTTLAPLVGDRSGIAKRLSSRLLWSKSPWIAAVFATFIFSARLSCLDTSRNPAGHKTSTMEKRVGTRGQD